MGEIADQIIGKMQNGKYHSSYQKENEMQHTGTITNIVPTQQGGYQSQGGYVYTFMMSIQTDAGVIQGEIGSKTQLYPLGCGSPINVEVTQTEHGLKFKKINPQYAGQQGQPQSQAPPQQSYNPPPQAPPQQNQRVPSEWDKPIDWHDKKQLLIVRQSSISNAIEALKLLDTEHIPVEQVLRTAKTFSQFVYDGIVQDELDQCLSGGQPNPEYSENPPAPPKDDIPY